MAGACNIFWSRYTHMPSTEIANLRAVLYRVSDVPAAAAFFRDALGCPTLAGPRTGWLSVAVGSGHSFWLAPGGRELPPLNDRWEQRGIIPILRTLAVDEE